MHLRANPHGDDSSGSGVIGTFSSAVLVAGQRRAVGVSGVWGSSVSLLVVESAKAVAPQARQSASIYGTIAANKVVTPEMLGRLDLLQLCLLRSP